eukprot:TRINITY_DN35937_c0_g1_i1.p1 TRINITY_DN35937_c0_g1~~TRINITY_DN35937_c0_g1_i1.p1  ORF type:complete len:583 (+),score=134.04 TRINITY_DN35937_c0_g1_i1:58-1749(+)
MSGIDDPDQERTYIRRNRVHIVLEELVSDTLRLRPQDPLLYIAMRLLSLKGIIQPMEDLIKASLEKKPHEDDWRDFVASQCGLRSGPQQTASLRSLPTDAPATPTLSESLKGVSMATSIAARKQRQISARACTVCGRDDRPGEQRSKGFKCHECVGIPSNPYFVKQIEEAGKVIKGRDEDGGFVMNDYTIMAQLGQGSYGKVRLCEHNISKQAYAVKCLSKTSIIKAYTSGNPTAQREDALRAIRDEIKIMKKLEHPNIIRIYGTMESDSEMMVVMEYLEGGPVYPSVFPAEPMKLRRLKRCIVGIAKGLDFLHNNGIIHRDIKPDNILTDKRGNVKLADFGMSVEAEGETGQVRGFAGSPVFMAPELFDTESAAIEGEPTDVWSFGVTLYCMAFGRLPPNFVLSSQLGELGASIRETEIPFDHASAGVNSLLQKMLTKEPRARISLQQICDSDLLRDVRIVKGHPVETIELGLKWDEKTESISLGPDAAGDPEGQQTFSRFMTDSGKYFQIITVNPYEVSLYDLSRDPRRRDRGGSAPKRQQRESMIEEEDWDSDDLEEEGM